MIMTHEEIMQLGVDRARKTMNKNIGGPFGAVITKGDEIIAVSSNQVLATHDPTAHAEVSAIRKACQVLGTHDLSGCAIYASGSPCPMCMSAIIWANIKEVYVSGSVEDAEEIGFRDNYIYNFIKDDCNNRNIVRIHHLDRKPARMLYREYAQMQKQMY